MPKHKLETSSTPHSPIKLAEAVKGVELAGEAQDIEEKGFLRDAQRTENLTVAIHRNPVIKDFTGVFASFGSCFAQNLQKWLANYGFNFWFERDICAHYSTESIANTVNWVVNRIPHSTDELYFYNDSRGGLCAYRYFFKKRFFGETGQQQVLARMNELDAICSNRLKTCEYLVVTLGTPRILRLRHNHDLINAALGAPPEDWYSEMLSVEQNVAQLERLYTNIMRLRNDNPPTLFLTISPQRYLFSEGVPELQQTSPFLDNTLGKSILRVAVHEFLSRHPNQPIIYYPAFEIVMEELRHFETLSTYDYVHINQDLTPKYIVKRFLQAYASDYILAQLPLIEKARLLLDHRDNLSAGGLSIPDDTLFAKEVLALIEKVRELGSLETMSPALLGPLANLIDGCGQTFK